MATYSIWILEAANITVSGGKSLSGFTQGEASHLDGETVRLDSADWTEVLVNDRGNDTFFDDNDDNQRLDGAQTIDGVTYANGTIIEAEYTIVLRDPATGIEYSAYGVNIRDSSPSYATVEGLVFEGGAGGFPPVGVDLEVVDTREGPGDFGEPRLPAADLAFPICFTPGTAIATPSGLRPVESLSPGDQVLTRDHGPQTVRWIGRTEISAKTLSARPAFRPVRISAGALGDGLPLRDLVVSQQHRILVTGWKTELMFGEPGVLVAARHLVGRPGIVLEAAATGVTYVHLMFDRHEILAANGAATESFRPGPSSLAALEAGPRAELLELFPGLGTGVEPARRLLAGWETQALVG